MATNYIIKSFDGTSERVYTTSTRKREIESRFNKLAKRYAKESNYSVERINLGYIRVTFYGSWGMNETEYWITRA